MSIERPVTKISEGLVYGQYNQFIIIKSKKTNSPAAYHGQMEDS